MQAAQRAEGTVAQLFQRAGGFILQPVDLLRQLVLGVGSMGVSKVALLQRDNLHLIAHLNKRHNLVQDEGL